MTDPLSPTPRAGFDPDVCAICVDVECDGVACVAALDSNDPEDHPMIEQVQTWVRVGRTSSTVIADLCANVDRLRAERNAAEAAAVPDGWKVVRVDGIPYLTPDRIRPLTEGEASDA